ncbi:MAG: CPBP family intramembrane metalloprotease [Chloroflexi bacterium]|nr:CPBP family intramembrane metalloprotease [Chloroflexota bacterium]
MASVNRASKTATRGLIEQFPWRFILIAFGISWTCWFFVALTGRNVFTDLEVGVVLVLGGFGPAIAGILMVYGTGDEALIRDYWRRVFDLRRIQPRWFVPIFLLYPVTVLLSFLISGLAMDISPLTGLLRNPGLLVTTLIFIFIFGPFSEELGWRDYALDWLQARFTAFVSSIILGVIWWAWHLPLLFVTGSFLNVTGNDPVFLAGYLGTVVIYSVLFTWVYNNNRRSVLAIILLHFSINLTSRLIVVPAEIFVVNSFVLIVTLAIILWLFGGKRLVKNQPQESEAMPA